MMIQHHSLHLLCGESLFDVAQAAAYFQRLAIASMTVYIAPSAALPAQELTRLHT